MKPGVTTPGASSIVWYQSVGFSSSACLATSMGSPALPESATDRDAARSVPAPASVGRFIGAKLLLKLCG
jgi:hypothetical protein